jgi:hypothetical protein
MRLESHEFIQIGETGKVIPTESITVLKTTLMCDDDGGVCGSPQEM